MTAKSEHARKDKLAQKELLELGIEPKQLREPGYFTFYRFLGFNIPNAYYLSYWKLWIYTFATSYLFLYLIVTLFMGKGNSFVFIVVLPLTSMVLSFSVANTYTIKEEGNLSKWDDL